ncbi:MAG: hypothetical protein CMK32_10035 [Porticoccaceae bacterium]|nr:hypothetical protein [Porticoccaceae bacterium]
MEEYIDESRRRKLRNTPTIEEIERRDMVAMAYMNSTAFGSGMSVMGAVRAQKPIDVPEPKFVENDTGTFKPGTLTHMVMANADDLATEIPREQFDPIDTNVAPSPREPLPSVDDFPLGLPGEQVMAGAVSPEAPAPVSPTPIFVQPEPQPQLDRIVEPPPPQPPPAVPRSSVPDIPEPDIGFEQSPPLPWLPFVPPVPMEAFEKDASSNQEGINGPQEYTEEAFQRFAYSYKNFLHTLGSILYGMTDRTDEALARIRELETQLDRRYKRRYQ